MPFENVKITIIRSDRKTLAVQIKNGEIIARAPKRMKEKDIFAFIGSKSSWIENHLAKQRQQMQALTDVPAFTQEEINALAQKAMQIIPQKVAFYAQHTTESQYVVSAPDGGAALHREI